jgi:hypothetical protein
MLSGVPTVQPASDNRPVYLMGHIKLRHIVKKDVIRIIHDPYFARLIFLHEIISQ